MDEISLNVLRHDCRLLPLPGENAGLENIEAPGKNPQPMISPKGEMWLPKEKKRHYLRCLPRRYRDPEAARPKTAWNEKVVSSVLIIHACCRLPVVNSRRSCFK